MVLKGTKIMISREELNESENRNKITLPPYISNNTHDIIEAELISIKDIRLKQKVKENRKEQLVEYPPAKPVRPNPSHPLAITWSPDLISLVLKDQEIVVKLWIWNSCYRPIYVDICGFWEEKIHLGASWRCYPRTRFRLAPGIKGEIKIRAKPHAQSVIPCAYAGLRLAAAHMRDNVTGYFLVPIQVYFLNYTPPSLGEYE